MTGLAKTDCKPFKHQPHRVVKHTQASGQTHSDNLLAFAEDLFECV